MSRYFILHGMKRSGNHGLINWIKGQDDAKLYNNIVPITDYIAKGIPFPAGKTVRQWEKHVLRRQLKKHLKAGEFKSLVTEVIEPKKIKIFSMEDHRLDYRPILDLPINSTNILLIRDAKNLFASRIKKAFKLNIPESYPKQLDQHFERILSTWKEHAYEFIGETNKLGTDTVKLSFNRWYSDKEYRESLSNKLSLTFSDNGFKNISGIGGGSSFDSTNYNGNPQNMKVLDREKSLTSSEMSLLKEIMSDKEVISLNKAILESELF